MNESMGLGGSKCLASEKMPETVKEMNRLDSEILMLRENVESLLVRLKPAMTPETPKNVSEKDCDPLTEIASAIKDKTDKVRMVNETLRSIFQRLEI